jgi:hypothetical protein
MLRGVDTGDEILVARADHNDDQVCSQREIDERKDADHHVRRRGRRYLHHEFGELDDELVDERRKPDDQAQEKRHHQPTAVVDDRFDGALDPVHSLRPPLRLPPLVPK